MSHLSRRGWWMGFVACLIMPRLIWAEFPTLTAGSFEQNMTSLQSIRTLPDNRIYDVITEQMPKPLTLEQLSSKQASQGTAWFSEGRFFLRLSEMGLTAYSNEIYPAMRAFFDQIISQSQAMSSATYQIIGSVQKKDLRGGDWELVVVADDIDLHGKLAELGANSIALISPADPKAIVNAQQGDSVELVIDAYGLLDAYGSKLPSQQSSDDITVQALFAEDGEVIIRTPAKVKQYSGILTTYRPARTTIVAGWAMKITHDTRRNQFTFLLGRSGTTSATLMPQPITEQTTVSYEALDSESYKRQLAEEQALREEERAISRAKADYERKEAIREKNREFYEKKGAEREKAIEENKPREEHWKGIALLVRFLTGMAIVGYLYSLVRLFQSSLRNYRSNLWPIIRSLIAVAWMGGFLAKAATTWGGVGAPIIDTWFICGIGGVVGMLILPSFRGMFKRTKEQKIRDAVHDGVSEAVGGLGWVIRPIAQYILVPIFVGGLFCPVLWGAMVVNAPITIWRQRNQVIANNKQECGCDEEDGEEREDS